MRSGRILAVLAVAIGLSQMLGFLTRLSPLRNFGLATVAAPLPLVFTDRGHYEDFATEFEVSLALSDGAELRVPLTPELYAKLPGPDDRRAVYATVIVMTPLLDHRLWETVIGFGFCRNGPLAQVLDLAVDVRRVEIRVATNTPGRRATWQRELDCAR